MPWNDDLRRLRDILVSLYRDEADCRRVVADAGLEGRAIDFVGSAVNRWQAVLVEADKQAGDVLAIVGVARGEYGKNAELAMWPATHSRVASAGGAHAQAAFAGGAHAQAAAAGGAPMESPDPLAKWLAFGAERHRRLQVIGFREQHQIRLELDRTGRPSVRRLRRADHLRVALHAPAPPLRPRPPRREGHRRRDEGGRHRARVREGGVAPRVPRAQFT